MSQITGYFMRDQRLEGPLCPALQKIDENEELFLTDMKTNYLTFYNDYEDYSHLSSWYFKATIGSILYFSYKMAIEPITGAFSRIDNAIARLQHREIIAGKPSLKVDLIVAGALGIVAIIGYYYFDSKVQELWKKVQPGLKMKQSIHLERKKLEVKSALKDPANRADAMQIALALATLKAHIKSQK
jgi:hypothetical protein